MYPTSRRNALIAGTASIVLGVGAWLKNVNAERERENRPLPQGRPIARVITMPDVQRQPVPQAVRTLRGQGLYVTVDGVPADTALAGPAQSRTVYDVSVAPGTPVSQNVAIDLRTGAR
jgi:hypothetical protein